VTGSSVAAFYSGWRLGNEALVGALEHHTRQSVLMRLITHDAFHSGEISLTLGNHGLGAIDMWQDLAREADRKPTP
jgi:hypothetical protein